MAHLRLGTRGSALALAQSGWVADQLRALRPGLTVDLVTITTRGDKILDRALSQVGGKGLFVTEIENALLANEIDFAVHSLKDVPTEQPAGLALAAFPERVDPRDVLVSRGRVPFAELPSGAVIGTSSLRRIAQLRHARPDLQFAPLRGNVDTRVRKMEEGQADAVVLAAAGLIRLGRQALIAQYLSPELCVPAAGQGILCLEARADDPVTLALLQPLNCADSRTCAEAERAVVAALGGSCQVPIGVLAEVGPRVTRQESPATSVGAVVGRSVPAAHQSRAVDPTDGSAALVSRRHGRQQARPVDQTGGELRIRAMVSDLQGKEVLRASGGMAEDVVTLLRGMGADELLAALLDGA